MSWLAFDIGGANLKLADGRGFAVSRPFALWRDPGGLSRVLGEMIADAPAADRLAVTMTGELCDCYPTKAEGVRSILAAVQAAAGSQEVSVYLVAGSLVSAEQAARQPAPAAASNWHALARFAGRFASTGGGLMLDVGSTTSDLVPLREGLPAAEGTDDTSRLILGELVYTGVQRSPLCAILPTAPYRQQQCPLAQELFATTWDAYLVLEKLPEEPESRLTADGRAATCEAACRRLARQLCADCDSFTPHDARRLAEAVMRAQIARLGVAALPLLRRLKLPLSQVVVSGRGEFLAVEVARRIAPRAEIISLAERVGEPASVAAAAHALAVLARESDPA